MSKNRIVVGVDGSAQSRRALGWAAQEAKLRGAHLSVIHAYTLPHLGAEQSLTTEAITRIQREAQDLIENEVDQLGELAAGIELSCAAAEGAPTQLLLDAAEEADLLVVGSRGRGGFKALLLGSVSQQCAHHATCPVVIVPPEPGKTP
jgi:nucleotide-binding universal stress UspA family protein